VRVADVAREQRAGLRGHFPGDRERLPVQLLEQVLLADDAHLLAVRVVGERLDDVGARTEEVAVELGDDLGMVEHDLRDERSRLDVAAPLELEEIALGADDRAALQAFEEAVAHRSIMSARTARARGPARGPGRASRPPRRKARPREPARTRAASPIRAPRAAGARPPAPQ